MDRSNRKVDRKKMQTILMPENMNQIIHESSWVSKLKFEFIFIKIGIIWLLYSIISFFSLFFSLYKLPALSEFWKNLNRFYPCNPHQRKWRVRLSNLISFFLEYHLSFFCPLICPSLSLKYRKSLSMSLDMLFWMLDYFISHPWIIFSAPFEQHCPSLFRYPAITSTAC